MRIRRLIRLFWPLWNSLLLKKLSKFYLFLSSSILELHPLLFFMWLYLFILSIESHLASFNFPQTCLNLPLNSLFFIVHFIGFLVTRLKLTFDLIYFLVLSFYRVLWFKTKKQSIMTSITLRYILSLSTPTCF